MTPHEIAKENWENIQHKLQGLRDLVYRQMLISREPLTTIDIAAKLEISILTVRPRVTELCELGLAELAGRVGRQGKYRAIPLDQVKQHINDDAFQSCQLQLL